MKTTLLVTTMVLLAILVSACGELIQAPTATQVITPAPTTPPGQTLTPDPNPAGPILLTPAPTQMADYPLVVQKALSALAAKLGIPGGQIRVVSDEEVEWPDGCLGVHHPGVMCTMVIVPGYRIILEANGTRYEYHANTNGSAMVLSPASGPATGMPGSKDLPDMSNPVLSWHVEGGIAGLCQDLSIGQDGNAAASSCVDGKVKSLWQAELTGSEKDQLDHWSSQFQSFTFTNQDGVGLNGAIVPDSMMVQLVFAGQGSLSPQEKDKQTMAGFAAEVFNRISKSS